MSHSQHRIRQTLLADAANWASNYSHDFKWMTIIQM